MTTVGWMNYVIPDPEVICAVEKQQEAEDDRLKLDQFSNYQME